MRDQIRISSSKSEQSAKCPVALRALCLLWLVLFSSGWALPPAIAQVTLSSGTGSVKFPSTAMGSSGAAVNASLELQADQTITSIAAIPSIGNRTEYTVGSVSGCAVDGATVNSSGTVCTVSITFSPAYSGLRNVPLKIVSSTGTWYIGLSGFATGPQAVMTPGMMSTVAGKGDLVTYGFSGDGGPATDALLNYPNSVAVDAAGNVYFSERDNHRVRRISAETGVITTVAGNGSDTYSGDGVLATTTGMYPMGVALDAAGNLYIADYYNYRVRKVDASTGIITTVAGNGSGTFSGDGGPATAAGMYPLAVVLDAAGDLYIADSYNYIDSGQNYRIRRVDASTGMITTVAGTGAFGSSGDGGLATDAKLWPGGLTLDANGNLFIVDSESFTVRRVDASTAIITTVAGNGIRDSNGDGGPATSASMEPAALAVDAAGNLFIADYFRGAVRVVDAATGMIRTVAGGNGLGGFPPNGDGGPATDATTSIRGLALDGLSNLWIADYYSHRIRKVDTHNVALAFQSASVGTISTDSPKAAVLSNAGTTALHFATPSSGYNPAITQGFTLDSTASSTCPLLMTSSSSQELVPGAACTLPVSFRPVTSGNISGTLTITDDNSNTASSTQTVSLSGTATGGSLGTLSVNVASATIAYGTASTNLSAVIIYSAATPTGAVSFKVDNGPLVPATCSAASGTSTCQASYTTGSLSVGTHSITVSIASDTNYSAASGTGTLTVTASTPKAVLSPTSGSFGGVTVGSTSASKAFTLASTGDGDLTITSISIFGANAASFLIASNTCGSTLSPSHSCEIDVTFSPTATGNASATLSVIDNAGMQTAALDGAGIPPSIPQANLSPASTSFGSVNVGSTTTSQTFTLKNGGNAALPITSISITGTNASLFVIGSNTCSSSLSAGGSCAIGISFKPSAVGSAIATLTVVDSVGTQTSTLSGTGVAVAVADFGIAATPSQQTIQRGAAANFTIQLLSSTSDNPFTTAATLTATGLPSGATVTFSPSSVVPGTSQASTSTMTVTAPPLTASLERSICWPFGTVPTASLGCVLLLWPLRRKKQAFNLLVLFIASVLCVGLTACGGETGFAAPGSTSTIVVTASSGSTTHTTTITLKVN